MNRSCVILSSLICFAVLSRGAQAVASKDMPQITVSATSSVTAIPDEVMITAGVITKAATADLAASENAKIATQVTDAAIAQGVVKTDIQTVDYSLNPDLVYPPNNQVAPPKIVGYTAQNSIRITVLDVKEVGKVIDAVETAGANNVSDITFAVQNPDKLKAKALVLALQHAHLKASILAASSGMALLFPFRISESSNYTPRPIFESRMVMNAYSKTSTPISTGQLKIQATVNVVYFMKPLKH